MKKILFYFVICSFFISNAQEYKSRITIDTDTISLKSLGLKGKVSSVSDFSFVAIEKNGSIIKGAEIESSPDDKKLKWDNSLYWDRNILSGFWTIKYKYYFDIKGRNTQKEEYRSSKAKNPYTTYNYIYSNGRLSEVKEKIIFVEGNITLDTKYTYEDKRVKQIDTYRNYEMWKRTLFEYEEGNLKSVKIFDSDADLSEMYVYEYNGKILLSARIVKMEYYEEEEKGHIKSEEIIKFDNQGNEVYRYSKYLIEDTYYINEFNTEYNSLGKKNKSVWEWYKYKDGNKFDTHINIYKYIYDDKNRIKEVYSCKKDETPFNITKYEYSEDTIIEENLSTEDNETSKETYFKGLLIKKKEPNGDVFEYKYTFDSKENWVKVIEYKNTIPIKMRVREIKYHINK
uniref:Prokaryotic membrane lipoprotein lipid attachment site n=1 Tax=Siphoviridae sp. ctvod4 TaxID=2827595 RepID=A0A8S5LL98_9CAUD|nr:MAG TPA: Prokaryotic membrane lipoprotein lipid attachment site [Siphoviridae sp. ctvod4]